VHYKYSLLVCIVLRIVLYGECCVAVIQSQTCWVRRHTASVVRASRNATWVMSSCATSSPRSFHTSAPTTCCPRTASCWRAPSNEVSSVFLRHTWSARTRSPSAASHRQVLGSEHATWRSLSSRDFLCHTSTKSRWLHLFAFVSYCGVVINSAVLINLSHHSVRSPGPNVP